MATEIVKAQEQWAQLLASPQVTNQLTMLGMRAVGPQRLARIVLTQFRANPKLLECSRESILGAIFRVAQYDLEPDGRMAALVPYKGECKLIIGYPGYLELAMRSGKVVAAEARLVYPGDEFSLSYGTDGPQITHQPNMNRDPSEEPHTAYAIAWIVNAGHRHPAVECMTVAEIDAIRKRAPGYDRKEGPHQQNPDEMRRKTVFRRLAKWLPQTPALSAALQADENPDYPITDLPLAVANAVAAHTAPAVEQADVIVKEPEPQVNVLPSPVDVVDVTEDFEPPAEPVEPSLTGTPAQTPSPPAAPVVDATPIGTTHPLYAEIAKLRLSNTARSRIGDAKKRFGITKLADIQNLSVADATALRDFLAGNGEQK